MSDHTIVFQGAGEVHATRLVVENIGKQQNMSLTVEIFSFRQPWALLSSSPWPWRRRAWLSRSVWRRSGWLIPKVSSSRCLRSTLQTHTWVEGTSATFFFFGIFGKQMLKVIKSKGRRKHQVLQLAILRFDFLLVRCLSWNQSKKKKRRTTTDICFRSALFARSVLLIPSPPPPLLHLLALSLLLLLASGTPPTLPSHLSSSHA